MAEDGKANALRVKGQELVDDAGTRCATKLRYAPYLCVLPALRFALPMESGALESRHQVFQHGSVYWTGGCP